MDFTNKQKAAMLLMTLDPPTASELVKGLEPKIVRQLAEEMKFLESGGQILPQTCMQFAQEFCGNLAKPKKEFHLDSFLDEILKNTVGPSQAADIKQQIESSLQRRDPFMDIRKCDIALLVGILENQHPQVAAVVISELPAKKSSQVLDMLSEGIRLSAVGRLTSVSAISREAKFRIAQNVISLIEAATAGDDEDGGSAELAPAAAEDKTRMALRKIAVILRNLNTTLRDALMKEITKKDSDAGDKILLLMVTWEDIPIVEDRSLQEGLRSIDSEKLALALMDADPEINAKIRANISTRASETIDEEMSLMSSPKEDEINEAREAVVDSLREMNEAGQLNFVQEE